MSEKRKASSLESSSSPYTKRARPTDPNDDSSPATPITPTTPRPQPKNDPVYGQKHAFPGLDDPVDEDQLFYGPAEDGIEYLRMVRSEARTLPAIFVSRTVPQQRDNTRVPVPEARYQGNDNGAVLDVEGNTSQTGFYSDGVYVAYSSAPKHLQTSAASHTSSPDPQEIYYTLLHHRFLLLRSTLKCTPPASVIASLGPQRPITLPRFNKRARAEWEQIIQTMDPRMAQLACMDTESVLRLLAIVTRLLSKTVRGGESAQVKRLGAWAWGLLGRCRAVGEMGSEDVGDIRELGKRAARILVKVRESEAVDVQGMDGGDGRGEEEEEEGEAEETEGEQGEPGYGTRENINENDGGGLDADENHVAELNITDDVVSASGNITEHITAHGEADRDIIPPTDGVDAQDELEAAKVRLQARLHHQQEGDTLEVRENEIEREGKTDINYDEEEEEAEEEEGEVDDDFESINVQQYTRAMLDMIISVIGEFYGQRDLLEFRDIWEEDFDVAW
ncbi:hypothetical protein EMPG_10795 [Blastomyces silverae]|uniref:Uncharacterized protein n=1 Tax=Blastomyces silverae TaxID=2060906 RepID=A0A0H1B2Y5_9EURO|nr:hypothetical protein EMPG_10795 [Blastomyces silverae]